VPLNYVVLAISRFISECPISLYHCRAVAKNMRGFFNKTIPAVCPWRRGNAAAAFAPDRQQQRGRMAAPCGSALQRK
jgi:hypothetical protein